jgi:hypothetical protein
MDLPVGMSDVYISALPSPLPDRAAVHELLVWAANDGWHGRIEIETPHAPTDFFWRVRGYGLHPNDSRELLAADFYVGIGFDPEGDRYLFSFLASGVPALQWTTHTGMHDDWALGPRPYSGDDARMIFRRLGGYLSL